MSRTGATFPFEILVDLMADHDAQSADGTPVSRVEDRLRRSLALASRAGLQATTIKLDARDFGWLCNARGIDRLGPGAGRLEIEGIRVERARRAMDSHIVGVFAGQPDQAFPTIQDPSRTPGFVPYTATPGEKAAMTENLRRSARLAALANMDNDAPMQ